MSLTQSYCLAIALMASSLALGGCRSVLGVDDYHSGGGGPPGTHAGCGANEVRSSDGLCQVVGVPKERCASGTTADDEGGCVALLPSAPCGPTTCTGPVCAGAPELLGARSCSATSDDWVCFGTFAPVPGGVNPDTVQYVMQSFAGRSDGTRASPWTTIGDALAHVVERGAVLVAAGTYDEDLVLTTPRVRLMGSCPDQVVIRGSGALTQVSAGYPCAYSGPKAALCVANSAAGSQIWNVSVTGKADGVAVVGATTVDLNSLQVSNTGRYGIRIEELGRPDGTHAAASATLAKISVRGAHGAGIYIAGAEVESSGFLNVSGTRAFNEYAGYGISVRAAPSASPDLKSRTPATVTLSNAVLLGNQDAALLVNGSSVTVSNSFLGNLPSVSPEGGGVVVERSRLLDLNDAHVTLKQTIIERTRDAAIDVRSGDATLDAVTIRNTFGRASDGCSGQGIRLRADWLAPATATVTHSLIVGSRQAAIHSLGGAVTVGQSILRGSAPDEDTAKTCAPHLGDGVTLEALPAPGPPSTLTLDHALIEGNARAAVANFGGDVTTTASTLSCNPHGLVTANEPNNASASGLDCGCDGTFAACKMEHAALEPWISPGKGSGHTGETEDWIVPVQSVFPLKKLTLGIASLLDAPDVAPAFPDGDGCAILHGVSKQLAGGRLLSVWGEGTVAATLLIPEGVVPTCGLPFGTGTFDLPLTLEEPIDMNRSVLFLEGPTTEVEFRQEPESGAKWLSFGGLLRANVDPGWTTITLGYDIVCGAPTAMDPGLVPGSPKVHRVLAEPGFIANAAWSSCFRPGPCPGGFPDLGHTGQCLSGAAAAAACEEEIKTISAGSGTYAPDCAHCFCAQCLPSWSACVGDPGCNEFIPCAAQMGCGVPCSSCPAVPGMDVAAATTIGTCGADHCKSVCPQYMADGGG